MHTNGQVKGGMDNPRIISGACRQSIACPQGRKKNETADRKETGTGTTLSVDWARQGLRAAN